MTVYEMRQEEGGVHEYGEEKDEKEDMRRGNLRKEICESTAGGDEWDMA